MLFAAVFALAERIRAPVGESTHLPVVSPSNITAFLARYPLAVVFFHARNYRFDYTNFGIYKYSGKIAFARAVQGAGTPYCAREMCAVAYRGGKALRVQPPPENAIGFAKWCQRVSRMGEVAVIDTPEVLKEVFQQSGNSLFGVNMKTKPDFVRGDDMQFFLVSNSMFNYFDMKVDSGLYLYRSADRQLIKTDRNYMKYTKTVLVDAEEINLDEGGYFGGFFIDDSNNNATMVQINVLTKVAQAFENKISFAIFYGDVKDEIKKISKLNFVQSSFFCVFDKENLTKRWVVLDSEKYTSVSFLENLVQKILSGEEKNTLLSGEKTFNHSLSFNEYQEKIAEKGDKFVLYLSKSIHKRNRVLLETILKYIHIDNFKFYTYDTDTNEVPDDYLFQTLVPKMIFYPEGKEKVVYEDIFEPTSIVRFLSEEGTNTIAFSDDYDPANIKKEVNTILYPKLFKNQKNNSTELKNNEL